MKIAQIHDGHYTSRMGHWLGRLLTFVGLVAFFLVTSSIFIPDGSRGDRGVRDAGGSSSTVIEVDSRSDILYSSIGGDLAVIGELVCRKYRIRILAADPEPLYSILMTDGTVVASRLTASAVALRFPDLPLLSSFGDLDIESSSDSADGSVRDGEFPLMSVVPTDGE